MNDKDQEQKTTMRSDGTASEGDERVGATESPASDDARQEGQPSQPIEAPGETPEESVSKDKLPSAEGAAESSSGLDESTGDESPSPHTSDVEATTNAPSPNASEKTVEDAPLEPTVLTEEAVPPLRHDEARGAIEAVLYAASEPLSPRDLRKILPEVGTEEIKQCLQELLELYDGDGRGLQIIEVAGGYQITTRPEFHERVSTLFHFKPPSRISIQALETLATIAYRQPVTVPEIQELRGVRSTSVIRTLLEKKLIRITGRKAVVGRPLLYGTTKEFLLRFGLKDLGELPRLEDMAEVFGEDMALHLDELGGTDAPSTMEGDEYPSGIISADQPSCASNGETVPNATESEQSESLPFNGDGDNSTNGSSREQDS